MSPLMIIMLLRYYGHARDYRDESAPLHAGSMAVTEAIERFREWDLLVELLPDAVWRDQDPSTRLSQFAVSDRGRAMVDAYQAVRLPVIQWVQP